MIKTYRPTSPGMRTRKTLVKGVENVRPEKRLTLSFKGAVGRSNGRVSVRHKEVGARKLYRLIDFKRDKYDIEAVVASIQDDPNRGCNIALLHYTDGEKRYILAPEGLKKGDKVVSGVNVEFNVGNSLPLKNMPLGMPIHNIELNPQKGGILARGAGNSALILAKEGRYVNVKLPSGEVKKILGECFATVGSLSNPDLRHTRAGKAGISRYRGIRPAVRGVAMADPAGDHPHAGSYNDKGVGMPSPKTPWGKKARGVKTRRRKRTSYTIVKERVRNKRRK